LGPKDQKHQEAEFNNGTFTDYLDVLNNSCDQKTVITLGEGFSRIVEIGDKISPAVGLNEVFQIRLEAYHSGKVRLHFHCPPGEEALFVTSWQQWFPKLKDLCSLEPAISPKGCCISQIPIRKPAG